MLTTTMGLMNVADDVAQITGGTHENTNAMATAKLNPVSPELENSTRSLVSLHL